MIKRNSEGETRYFGFVEMEHKDDIAKVVAALDQTPFMGRIMRYCDVACSFLSLKVQIAKCYACCRVRAVDSTEHDNSNRDEHIQLHVSFLCFQVPQLLLYWTCLFTYFLILFLIFILLSDWSSDQWRFANGNIFSVWCCPRLNHQAPHINGSPNSPTSGIWLCIFPQDGRCEKGHITIVGR